MRKDLVLSRALGSENKDERKCLYAIKKESWGASKKKNFGKENRNAKSQEACKNLQLVQVKDKTVQTTLKSKGSWKLVYEFLLL